MGSCTPFVSFPLLRLQVNFVSLSISYSMKKEESKQVEQVADDQAQQPDQEQVSQKYEKREGVQVLIPFDSSKDNVRRLQAVIRSFELYAQFYFTPVVVGDCPSLFNDSVMAIPFEEGVSHDLLGATVSGIHSELINDNFIVAPLQTYLNQPILLAHFQIPKIHAKGYELRFPMFINKSAMLHVYDDMAKKQEVTEQVFGLYFKFLHLTPMWLDWVKDFTLLPVISERPAKDKLRDFASYKAAIYVQHDLVFDELLNGLLAHLFNDQVSDELGAYENPA